MTYEIGTTKHPELTNPTALNNDVCRYLLSELRRNIWYLTGGGRDVDTEGIVRETIIKIVEHFSEYNPMLPITGWANSIMRNTYKDILRNTYRCVQRESRQLSLEDVDESRIISPLREESSKREVTKRSIKLKQIVEEGRSSGERGCEELHLQARGYSLESIGIVLNKPIGTVKSGMSAARMKIQRKMEALEK